MRKKLTLCAASSTLSRKPSHSNTKIVLFFFFCFVLFCFFFDSVICRSASSLSRRLCGSSVGGIFPSRRRNLPYAQQAVLYPENVAIQTQILVS